MPAPTAAETSDPAAARAVPCFGCLYDLRTLPPEGACPECGLPVGDSHTPQRLDRADPGWVRRLRRGATLAAGEYVAIAAGLAAAVALRVSNVPAGGEYLLVAMLFAMAIFGIAGGWLVSTPEPGRKPGPLTLAARVLTAVAAAAYVKMVLLLAYIAFLEGDGRSPFVTTLVDYANVAYPLINAAKVALQLAVLASVLRRVPGRKLAGARNLAAVAVPAAWLCLAIGPLLGDRLDWVRTVMSLYILAAVVAAAVYLFACRRAFALGPRA